MFIIYRECNKVSSKTCEIFANRYPEKQKPSTNDIKRIIDNFKNFTAMNATIHNRKQIVNDENIKIAILSYFAAYLMTSLREVAIKHEFPRCPFTELF